MIKTWKLYQKYFLWFFKLFLVSGVISSALIPVNTSVFFFGPTTSNSTINIDRDELYSNYNARTAFLTIDLLGLFNSLFILVIGLANVINFDSFKQYPWVALVSLFPNQKLKLNQILILFLNSSLLTVIYFLAYVCLPFPLIVL